MFNISWLLGLSRWQKRLLSIVIDFFGLIVIAIFAIWLRFGEAVFPITEYAFAIILLALLAMPIFIKQGLYRAVIRYIGYRFAWTLFVSVSMLFVLWAAILFMADLSYPRSAIVITWLLALFYLSATRIAARWLLTADNFSPRQNEIKKQVVIFGAGSSGKQLLNAMHNISGYRVCGVIDDSKQLHRHEINSVKVYSRDELKLLIEQYGVTDLFLAIPSLSATERSRVLAWLEPFPVKVSTLPGLDEIVNGKVSFADIREIEIEDLLGRNPVPPRHELLEACIQGKSVLITGAGGSIGSELCRQVVKLSPKRLLLLELSELALYQVERELSELNLTVELVPILGNVLDKVKLERLIQFYDINTIYHAAAYKHVPLVEHNIGEGIKNNSFGTFNVAQVAAENKVENFVLISTDKAVRPTNFMGASKRLAEMSLQALQDKFSGTRFVMVRFGNVLGSSGSVIPLFRKQIANNGPVTVTHKEITRYFMTIPEAASLVIQSGSMGQGGDVFVLDMGVPVKIVDLARKVIHLSGLEVIDENGDGDIEIQYTGLRPGEKLYEELLIGDNVDGTGHPKIMRAHEEYIDLEQLKESFELLEKALANYDFEQVEQLCGELVSGFNHQSGIVDYLQNKTV